MAKSASTSSTAKTDNELATHLLPLLMQLQGQLVTLQGKPQSDPQTEFRTALAERVGKGFLNIVKTLQPELVLDIGAGGGGFARKVRGTAPNARVVAFEANPAIHAKHQKRMADAGVEYVNGGVADADGPLSLMIPVTGGAARPGMGSLLTSAADSAESVEVAGLKLDTYLQQAAAKPSVMRIDVKGAVGLVLQGAEQTLANCQALYVELESKPRWSGQMLDRDVIALLARHGLYPVIQDALRGWQGAFIFLRGELIARPDVVIHIQRIFGKTAAAA